MERTENTATENVEVEGKLFNFRPVFFTAVLLCLGIAFAYLHTVYGVAVWWGFCLLPAAAVPFIFCRSKRQALKILLALFVLTVSFCGGFLRFTARMDDFTQTNTYAGEQTVVGRVVEKVGYENGTYRLTLTDVRVGGMQEKGKLVVYLSDGNETQIRLSDEVVLKGDLRTDIELFDNYGFRAYAIGKDVRFYMTAESWVKTERTFDLFLFARQRIENVVYAGMPETPAAVTLALLTGDTSGIDSGLLENVRRGGVAHLFAVSGLHIGALYAFCLLLVKKTGLRKMPKPVQFVFTCAVLLFYGGVCGFSASVVRAIVMCLIFYASSLMGIGSDSLESLGAAAIVVLLLSPTALFEVGFQLSFLACLGIVLLSRRIRAGMCFVGGKVVSFFKKPAATPIGNNVDRPLGVWERMLRASVSFLSVTFAAQVATAPVLLRSFGYLSGWSLLLNCLFVPLVSAAFAFLLALVAIACMLPVAANGVILYVPSVVLSALTLLFEAVDFSTFSLETTAVASSAIVMYYTALLFLTDKWNTGRKIRYTIAFVCICACMAMSLPALV